MRTALVSAMGVWLMSVSAIGAAPPEKRTVQVMLTVPSTAYKIQIKEIYQTNKELWVLSQVKGGGIGLTVISQVKDSVKVDAPNLPVKHFVLGKTWGWKKEDYNFLKNRKQFDQMVAKAMAMRIFQRKMKTSRFIIMYKKEIFTDGKTKNGETLEQLAKRHSKQFDGKFERTLKIINGFVATIPPENAKRLGQLPEVRAVEEDRIVGIPPVKID